MDEIDGSKGWSDATMLGFGWDNDGKDLLLDMLFLSGVGRRGVRFTWAHSLKMDLSFGDHQGGSPMLWSAVFERQSKDSCHASLDFASAGIITFLFKELLWMEPDLESNRTDPCR